MGALANGCLGLISRLTPHVEGLTELITESSNEDQASAVSSQSSLVESLTALAEMFDLISRISPEPLVTDYRTRCIATLLEAIKIIHRLGHDDYFIVGPFLGVRYNGLG
jgi:hypothetical protein